MRTAKIERKTNETNIRASIDLDGKGEAEIATGIGFFDHMLSQLARHSMIDIDIRCEGDLAVDDHHSVEDCAIVLGQAIREAVGDKAGINRYGHAHLAMDDAMIECALDISGRGYLVFDIEFPTEAIGGFDVELVREFFQGFAMNCGLTLHLYKRGGINSHHIAEATFKACARALRQALEPDLRAAGAVPSTKGQL